MKMRSTILILCLLALGSTDCSKKPRENQDSASRSQPLPAVGQTTQSVFTHSVDTASVAFAIVFANGAIVPFALLDSTGSFFNPWPVSTYEEDTAIAPRPTIKLPRTWYFYSLDQKTQNVRFQADSLLLIDIQCYRNWAYASDLFTVAPEQNPTDSWRLGFASTTPLTLIPQSSMLQIEPNFETIRQEMHMLPSGTPGYEGAYDYQVLGFFRLRNRLMGAGISLPWESEVYELFEINQGSGRKLIQVRGGGC